MTRLAIVMILLGFSTAGAETRSGLMLGASFGGGGMSGCRDCDGGSGVSADFHVGWWIRRNLAISYEGWVVVADANALQKITVQGFGLLTVTTRIAKRWWVKGGAGLAMYQSEEPFEDALTNMDPVELKGFGIGTGVGYELFQSRGSIAIDVSARFALGLFPDHGTGSTGSVGVGVTWN